MVTPRHSSDFCTYKRDAIVEFLSDPNNLEHEKF